MVLEAEIIQGKGFEAEIVRTNRIKTASIKVVEGSVSVVTPKDLPVVRVEQLIKQKTQWIKDKIRIHEKVLSARPKEYVSGECFSYLGKNYRLKVVQGVSFSVKLKNGRLVVQVPRSKREPDTIRDALIQWYQARAEAKLKEKSERFAKMIGVTPVSVGIKSFKSRWGSCHQDGRILFNWKVIMASSSIVDYVVAHELCHMHHHNHSPEYWRCVEQVVPDYLGCKEWLKENAGLLQV